MQTRLTPVPQALVFTALVLALATGMALAIPPSAPEGVVILYMYTPMLAALVMMLVVTRDGHRREGWRSLGLGTAGLRYWPFSVIAPLLVGMLGLVVAYALPSVTPTAPDNPARTVVMTIAWIAIPTVGWVLGEEFGWRGYLLPRLRALGDRWALVLSSLSGRHGTCP